MNLYPDQHLFVAQLREAFREYQSVLGQAPTGFGKTVVSAFIAREAAAKGNRVGFTCHRKNLIQQTKKTFYEWGISHGTIAAGHPMRYHENVQVASIDTLVRRLDKVPAFDLLVVDEAHLACSRTWSRVLEHYRKAGCRILGNTATPERLDGRPLAEHFDAMVLGPEVRELIKIKRLSDYRIFAPGSPDMAGVRRQGGDWRTADLEEIMGQQAIVGDAIKHYRRLMPGRRALAFCVSVAESERTAQRFNGAGIPAAHIDGNTPDKERKRIIGDFADGRIHVLCNVELITTGFDLSSQVGREAPVDGMIGLRPTQSMALYLQMCGRALRKKDDPAVIADHAGNWLRHGLPCDEREWTLEGRDRKAAQGETATALRLCPSCFGIYASVLPVCPNCGTAAVLKERAGPDTIDGELEEVDLEAERAKRAKRQAVGRARTIEALVEVAIERGNKIGWAAHVHAARTGMPIAAAKAKEREVRAGTTGNDHATAVSAAVTDNVTVTQST